MMHAGGKPSQGTRKDQRLNVNKGKPRPPKTPKKGKQ
jgi:hypothetical protein